MAGRYRTVGRHLYYRYSGVTMRIYAHLCAMLNVGDPAPLFELLDQNGEAVRLQDCLQEKVVVLFFYPKDHTRVCTAEVCLFRDEYEQFVAAGAEVIGISSDGKNAHSSFAGKHQLPFRLLTDRKRKVRKLYGVKNVWGVIPGRATFVINQSGSIAHAFSSMPDFEGHVMKALEVVKRITSTSL